MRLSAYLSLFKPVWPIGLTTTRISSSPPHEDSAAQVDANFVICDNEKLSEIQVTGEEFFFSSDQYQELYKLAQIGINQIISKQKSVLE